MRKLLQKLPGPSQVAIFGGGGKVKMEAATIVVPAQAGTQYSETELVKRSVAEYWALRFRGG